MAEEVYPKTIDELRRMVRMRFDLFLANNYDYISVIEIPCTMHGENDNRDVLDKENKHALFIFGDHSQGPPFMIYSLARAILQLCEFSMDTQDCS